jgi:hypothetical protein
VGKKDDNHDRAKAARPKRRRPPLDPEEERILGKAAAYCIRNLPLLWTPGGIKEETAADGSRCWLIAVYLRFPTGHEGHVGDLLYDGEKFTELTDRQLMYERSKTIEDDPERLRRWNEYRASTLQTEE